MQPLSFTSIQAANADTTCQAITQYVGKQLGGDFQYFAPPAWQMREQAFDKQSVRVCWMCGAVYVRKLRQNEAPVELLAAPVMASDRYQNKPIYFSDVIVRAESSYQTFADLRGTRWAYNEPNSHSGYAVTRWYLAEHNYGNNFFGQSIGSGSHQRSLQLLLAGQVDATAIDSTVLDTELILQPDLANQIRVVESFGPSPIPPWVMNPRLPLETKEALRQAFTQMHQTPEGQAILRAGQIDHFVTVTDSDYDPIRQMHQIAQQVTL